MPFQSPTRFWTPALHALRRSFGVLGVLAITIVSLFVGWPFLASQTTTPAPSLALAAVAAPPASPAVITMAEGVLIPTPAEVKVLLPGVVKSPVMLEFSSAYCGYCKRFAPVLKKVAAKYPMVRTVVVDGALQTVSGAAVKLSAETLQAAFQPDFTPILLGFNTKGEALVAIPGAPSEKQLSKAFDLLRDSAKPAPKPVAPKAVAKPSVKPVKK